MDQTVSSSVRDCAKAIAEECGYKKCSASTVSMAQNTEDYGVRFTAKAKRVYDRFYPPLQTAKKKENRRCGVKLTVRLTEEMAEAAKTKMALLNIGSWQELAETLIGKWVEI